MIKLLGPWACAIGSAACLVCTPALAAEHAEPPVELTLTLKKVGTARVSGAEIVEFDRHTGRLLVSGRDGVTLAALAPDGTLTPTGRVTTAQLAAIAGLDASGTGRVSVSHVAPDPLGRGFAACTVMPADKARAPGFVALFSIPDAALRAWLPVGFGPDAFKFAADGSVLVVADEGEPAVLPDGSVADPPGGLSVLDLSSVRDASGLAGLTRERIRTIELDGPVIDAAIAPDAARASGLRIAPWVKQRRLDLEPESLAIHSGKAYVTLQENNGLAVFDLATSTWTALRGLGVLSVTADLSDRDGLGGKPAIKVDRVVDALPMPDQISAIQLPAAAGDGQAAGRVLLVLAAEGDDRGDADDREASPVADRARLKHLAEEGRLGALFPPDQLADRALGRLRVCTDWGLDDEGRVARPTMQGARSAIILDARTLERVGDTGSAFERAMAQYASEWFNANSDASTIDRRSPDRGPEPEGVVAAVVAGRPLAFVTLERPGAVAIVDLADPAKPRVVGLHVSADEGDLGPEGVAFIPADVSPTGKPLLAVGYETSGTVVVYELR
jgi:hypothetical protein